jgi:ABC-type lipoprotein export system ATPase subunit
VPDPAAGSLRVEKMTVAFGKLLALDGIDLAISAGMLAGFAGPSGSGKTSLLHAVAGLLRPRTGRVAWGGVALSELGEGARDAWRRLSVGLVFQDFHLVGELDALANVLLPVRFDHFRLSAALRARASALLDRVGITTPHRIAGLLSRGEQQRVAIARALLRQPRIVLADEPTASLDAAASRDVAELLVDTCRTAAATLVVVSHDAALLSRLDRVHELRGGRLL